MPQSNAERQGRFKKMFPDRVERLIDQLRKIGNCSNERNYKWTHDLVKRAWIEIAKQFEATAKLYGVKFEVTIDGQPVDDVDTSGPLQ